jgi:hypothetical protein
MVISFVDCNPHKTRRDSGLGSTTKTVKALQKMDLKAKLRQKVSVTYSHMKMGSFGNQGKAFLELSNEFSLWES